VSGKDYYYNMTIMEIIQCNENNGLFFHFFFLIFGTKMVRHLLFST